MERIVEINLNAKLSVKHKQLVIRTDIDTSTVPLEDIAVIMLADSQITVTNYLLSSCSANNIAVIVCDPRKLPVSVLMPLTGNSLHSKVLLLQANMNSQLKNRIWKQVIKAKISSQIAILEKRDKNSKLLKAIRTRVKTGDSENCEARAAAIYWKELFGKKFVRDFEKGGINACLNYGYAVIRAVTARAIVGTGLHPSLGVHHHNQYDSFCLANDLMEPFRPLIDNFVFELNYRNNVTEELNRECKHYLLSALNMHLNISGESYPMFTALERFVNSVKQVMMKNQKEILIPELIL